MQKALNGKSSIRECRREEMPPAESVSDGNYVKCVRELMKGSVQGAWYLHPGNNRYLFLSEIACAAV
jgi:hypothetical protein